jgi:hypothetical protein
MRLVALLCCVAPVLASTIDPLDDVVSDLESTSPTGQAFMRCQSVLNDNSVKHLHSKAKTALAEFFLGPGLPKGTAANSTKALQLYQSLTADDNNDPG